MNTEIHLSIDDGPPRILEMGRELSLDEKARVKAAVCGFIRMLQVWLDEGDRMRASTSPDSGATGIRGRGKGVSFTGGAPDEECRAKLLPDWLKMATRFMIAGNYSEKHTTKAFMKVRGKTASAMNTKLLSWDRVSCTLVKSEISATGIIHPDCIRYLTIAEMKRMAIMHFLTQDVFRVKIGNRPKKGAKMKRFYATIAPCLMPLCIFLQRGFSPC